MKKLLLFLVLCPVVLFSQNNLVKWFNADFKPSYMEGNITASKIQTVGGKMENLAWGEDNIFYSYKPSKFSATLDKSSYVEFAMGPEKDYKIQNSTFNFKARTNGGSPSIQVRYSTSPSFSDDSVLQSEITLTNAYKSFNLTIPKVVNGKQLLYIRIYVYNTYNDVQLKSDRLGNDVPTISGIVSLETPVKPLVKDDRSGTLKNSSVNVDILSNDDYRFSGSLKSINANRPKHGTVKVNGFKDITYTPASGYVGYDSFTYTVTNSAGVSNTAKVELQVLDSGTTVEPLVRWNKKDFEAKNYSNRVNGVKLGASIEGLEAMGWGSTTNGTSFRLYNLPKPANDQDGSYGYLVSTKYLEMSMKASNENDIVYLNTLEMRFRSSGGGNITIRYSKSANFSDNVFTLKDASSKDIDNVRYDGTATDMKANFLPGTILYPGEMIYIRVYTYNTYNDFFIDYQQDKEIGPVITGVVSPYFKEPLACQKTVTWNGTLWEGGTPDLDTKAVISGNYDTAAHGEFEACTLAITNNAVVTVNSKTAVTVKNEIVTEAGASLIVKTDANLIQINEAAVNTGTVTVEKKAHLKRLDYIYWGSPVKGQELKAFSPGTVESRFYTYNEANDFFETIVPKNNIFGTNKEGQFESAAKGYAIRASNYYPAGTSTTEAPIQVFTGVFKGVPNNGDISFPLKYKTTVGTYVGNGYNLLGNPYPSNIDFDKLVDDNKDLIDGTAYFWTNVNANPEMQGSSYPKEGTINNYATLNGSGSIPATQGRVDGLASKSPSPIIEVGQGFMIRAKKEGNVVFKNAHRTTESDGIFFNKGSRPVQDRYWLELTTPLNVVTTALVAYIDGASDDFEDRYDAKLLSVGADALFTQVDDFQLGIQGRQFPLHNSDVVQLGAKHYEDGEYTLALAKKEGVFEDAQPVYLKDKQTGNVVNLTENSYTFFANKGLSENRFEIFYKKESTLGTVESNQDAVDVYKDAANFVIQSKAKNISKVELYDTAGRLIYSVKPNAKETVINADILNVGMYVVKIVDQDGSITTKKIIK